MFFLYINFNTLIEWNGMKFNRRKFRHVFLNSTFKYPMDTNWLTLYKMSYYYLHGVFIA